QGFETFRPLSTPTQVGTPETVGGQGLCRRSDLHPVGRENTGTGDLGREPGEDDDIPTPATVDDAGDGFGGTGIATDQPAGRPPDGGYLPSSGNRDDDHYAPTAATVPCGACGGTAWHRAGDGWTCSTCPPAPGTP